MDDQTPAPENTEAPAPANDQDATASAPTLADDVETFIPLTAHDAAEIDPEVSKPDPEVSKPDEGAMKPPALDVLVKDRVTSPDDPMFKPDPETPDEQIAAVTADVALRAAQTQRDAAQQAVRDAIARRADPGEPPTDDDKEPVVPLAGGSTSNGKDLETLRAREQRANALALLDERIADLKEHRDRMQKSFDADLVALGNVLAETEKERADIVAQDERAFGTDEVPAADRKLHESAIDPLMNRVRPVVREMAPYS